MRGVPIYVLPALLCRQTDLSRTRSSERIYVCVCVYTICPRSFAKTIWPLDFKTKNACRPRVLCLYRLRGQDKTTRSDIGSYWMRTWNGYGFSGAKENQLLRIRSTHIPLARYIITDGRIWYTLRGRDFLSVLETYVKVFRLHTNDMDYGKKERNERNGHRRIRLFHTSNKIPLNFLLLVSHSAGRRFREEFFFLRENVIGRHWLGYVSHGSIILRVCDTRIRGRVISRRAFDRNAPTRQSAAALYG